MNAYRTAAEVAPDSGERPLPLVENADEARKLSAKGARLTVTLERIRQAAAMGESSVTVRVTPGEHEAVRYPHGSAHRRTSFLAELAARGFQCHGSLQARCCWNTIEVTW